MEKEYTQRILWVGDWLNKPVAAQAILDIVELLDDVEDREMIAKIISDLTSTAYDLGKQY